jgi:hypothetical protein
MTLQQCFKPLCATAAATVLLVGSVTAADTTDLLREQKTVVVSGVKETWKLVWAASPQSVCGAEDVAAAQSCACAGFAYGEAGALSLVRLRPGAPPERLSLAPFYKDTGLVNVHELAVLPRWPPIPATAHNEDDDWHHASDWNFLRRVQERAPVDVMRIADYTHDGRSSEFLLQVSTQPCGKRALVLIGVSRLNPHLHVFSSAEAPDTPLVLGARVWDAVRRGPGPWSIADSPCEEHQEGTESIVTVEVRRGIFHVRRDDRSCAGEDTDRDGGP